MGRRGEGWKHGRGALALLCLLLAASCGGAASTPTVAPTPTPLPTPTPIPVVIQVQPLSAQVAYAVDLTTGAQLYDLNGDMPFAPASTMKIVTALLARQLLTTDTLATVADSDLIDPTVYSTMGLEAGDEISVGDLLRGLLIPSGGDAGLVLARVGGLALGASESDAVGRFVDELNTFAQKAGMQNSHFSNPVGDDAPDELSTARDLVRATALLLNDPLLTDMVQTAQVQVSVAGPDARVLTLINTNQLLARDDVFGVKTGSEDVAGQCLIAGFWRGDSRIVTVVLGSADRYADTSTLINAIDAAYQPLARAP